MLVLVGGELRTIYLDRDEHDAEQKYALCQQEKSFQEARDSSERQFESTMTEFKTLVDDEGKISRGMQRNMSRTMDAMTGGDSYPVIMALLISNEKDNAELPLTISVAGKNPLYEVTIEMQEGALDAQSAQYFISHIKDYVEGRLRQTLHFSSISTTYGQNAGVMIHPVAGKVNQYNFWTYSRNKPTRENLLMRYNDSAQRWEMAWKIYREGTTKPINELDFPAPPGKSPALESPRH